MTWFAFQGKNGGKAIDLAGVQEKIAVSFGFHGYATEAQAEAKPNAVNVLTGGEADLLIADYNAALSTQSQPGGKNASNPFAQITAGAGNALSGLVPQGVAQFFADISASATWLRVAKVVVGGTLLLFALAHMTSLDNAAASVIRKAPLPV